MQPSVELSVTVVGLIEQHGAWTLIEKIRDCCTGSEALRVRSEYQVSSNIQGCGFAAVWLFADQHPARCNRKPLVDVRKNNQQREDDVNVLPHRDVHTDNTLDQTGRSKFRIVE